MSISYARPLTDHQGVDAFLENCLGIGDELELPDSRKIPLATVSKKIRDAENALAATTGEPTLDSLKNRVKEYRDEHSRKNLRLRILTELIEIERLDDDDEIQLGHGGAKPKTELKKEKQAIIIIGLPASGKSSLVNKTADALGAFILDADFAKRKLPEFDGSFAGANLVHEESSKIIFGPGLSLLDFCRNDGINIAIPKIGNHFESIEELRDGLISRGYAVHLCCTVAHRQNATLRAVKRFLSTDRYVPLGLIFDGYANDPIMNYYRFRVEDINSPGKWASLGAMYTEENGLRCDVSNKSSPIFLLGQMGAP
ncbi:zeta toxin family protein [Ralstonia solanacearum]|uniref:zeta toxin family protein n=1 Tax=Ralstonia solanacearum TaxID=305 RepID=UPI0009BEE89E|nr:zeta toxin family protein [Ralstonia solanacearum]